MSPGDLLIPAAVAGFFLVLCALFYMRGSNRPRVNRTVMRRMARPGVTLDDDISRNDRPRLSGREFLSWFYRLNLLQKLEENLWQAGIYARIADVLLVILLMFTAGLAVGQAIWGKVLISIGMGAGVAMLPIIYVRVRRQRRIKAFAKQLPYALDLIKSSLEAGHTLLRGLQVVGPNSPIRLAPNFAPPSSRAASVYRWPARLKRCSSGCRRRISACWSSACAFNPKSAVRSR